jgi:tRNA pseudouridine38-40 synthase
VTGSAPDISVAGRTDAGVHAWGQVASLSHGGEPAPLMRSLNGVLPADVAVREAARAPDGFDARRDARSRIYCYRLLTRPVPSPFERRRSLWWPHPIDDDALGECARLLRGMHDFTAFTPTQTDHVRFERTVLDARWTRTEPLLELWIEADTFMRHMVRVLVGTMLEVAGGRRTPDDFARLLKGAPRSAAAETAEPHGLYLASVTY